ncbi:MAG: crotonyl-CoA carboxylase/reductase [Polyangiaceae bacterium]|jgi:crotonyl-CoA carboxylase/reductase|nr:crotonyl-CoA carboxylase/reductase [Polyangiaceae bacterium]
MAKELYDVGQAPPPGEVPKKMHGWLIRPNRFGEPRKAFQKEVVDTPEPGDDEVLVYVMAAGVNYNNVWAGLGVPIDIIGARNKAGEPEEFHIGGSDASGIVYKVGRNVRNLKVGDEVVIHCGTWSADCPMVKAGVDPMYSPTFRIWGYETNWGSFAQFTKVQAHQCLPKPKHLTWEAAAAYMLVGATAYRMLMGWDEHALRKGDAALIWGGAGGLGSMAIQIARARGAIPVAVISSTDKIDYCMQLGAKGCINRNDFDHWGMLPHWKDNVGYAKWLKGVRKFGKAFWDVLGEKRNPRIVFEHPGESTIPTSIFVCDTGGMVVICAGTTGYNATVDLRYLWMRQKRLQGSHFANDEQSAALNDLVIEGKVDPCMSRVLPYGELPDAHQLMYENRHPHGNMAVLVGAVRPGLGVTASAASPASVKLPPRAFDPAAVRVTPRAEPSSILPSADDHPVRELMHVGVLTCGKDATVEQMARMLLQHRIHAIVVVDDQGRAVGVVSQTDLVLARQGRAPAVFQAMRASEIMTPDLVVCTPDTAVSEAVTTMTRLRIHRLVVEERERGVRVPIGVISMTDVVRHMMGQPPDRTPYRDPE